MAKPTIRMETAEWKRTMKAYMALAKKTGQEATRKQAPKLFFLGRTYIQGPHGNAVAVKDDIKMVIENPKFIAWFLNKIHGKGNWGRYEWDEVSPGKGWRNSENDVGDKLSKNGLLTRRMSSVKFMWAVLSKMGSRLADKSIPFEGAFPGVLSGKMVLQVAQDKVNTIIHASYKSARPSDAAQKKRMFKRALRFGEKAAIADMKVYINRKLNSWAGMK